MNVVILSCSVSSNIAQTFLQSVLEAFSHTETQVRLAALQVTLHTLVQGLVHPGQCVPYLIAMSTDSEPAIKLKADQQLTECSNRFGGFMQVGVNPYGQWGCSSKSHCFYRPTSPLGSRKHFTSSSY